MGFSTEMTNAAADLLSHAARRGWTIGVAESLTGGLVQGALTSVAGCSRHFRGGVVAYHSDLKSRLLSVSEGRLAEHGPVDHVVSEQMAAGVAELVGADVGVATTGVAGPGPADGHDAGTVHLAVVAPNSSVHRACQFSGGRDEVRRAATQTVLELACELLAGDTHA